MSDSDELKKSLENEIHQYDDFLSKTKEYADIAPFVFQRKQEAEAKITFLDHAPEDFLSEFAPSMLLIQKNDEKQIATFLPALPGLTVEAKSYIASTSGTSTAYMSAAYGAVEYYSEQGQDTNWFSPVAVAFTDLAAMKSRNRYLPERLNRINAELGRMYVIANDSVSKARSEIITVDQAVMHMRDVLQQLWGGLADLANKLRSEEFRSIQHKQLKKENHRNVVARCLATNEDEHQKFVLNLDGMAKLHIELSDTSIGKNPLSIDISRMNGLYDRWVILIDDLSNLVIKLF